MTTLSQFSWQHATFLDKVTSAFEVLRNAEYFAAQNFRCCTSCGLRAIPPQYHKYVFYHEQDHQHMVEGADRLYLRWAGDGNEIVAALQAAGLYATWPGSEDKCVMIHVPIQRTDAAKAKETA